MKKYIAAIVLALAALIATPAAANAAGYVPTGGISISGDAVPGGVVVVTFSDGSFLPDEPVDVSVTGAGAVTLGALPTTTVDKRYTASSTGSLVVRVTLPQGASGTYTLTARGLDSGRTYTATFTVVPSAAAGAAGTSGGKGNLAFTGGTVSSLALWAAGGALLVGGGVLATRTAVRRQRAAA